MFDIESLFKPLVSSDTCHKHGVSDFFEMGIESGLERYCVKCWNDEQRAAFDAIAQGMRNAGHEVTEYKLVGAQVDGKNK